MELRYMVNEYDYGVAFEELKIHLIVGLYLFMMKIIQFNLLNIIIMNDIEWSKVNCTVHKFLFLLSCT